MAIGKQREKVLHGLGAARGAVHRYTIVRWVVGVLFTLAIALLPATGMLRFDLWGGHHSYLGAEVGLVEAAKAFAFPFLAINIVILLVSRFLGRYLCGFVCPIGSLARLGEWLHWRGRKSRVGRLLPGATLFAASLVLAAITFSFWIDWRVFLQGSVAAMGVSAGFLLATTLVLFYVVHGLGLRFCRDYCPSGVYFAVLGPETKNGIEFVHPEACTDCHACETVCPSELRPREIAGPPTRGGRGFYPEGMTNHALCLRCGDCVAACEGTTAKNATPTPLRMGWLPGGGVEHAPEAGPLRHTGSGREG